VLTVSLHCKTLCACIACIACCCCTSAQATTTTLRHTQPSLIIPHTTVARQSYLHTHLHAVEPQPILPCCSSAAFQPLPLLFFRTSISSILARPHLNVQYTGPAFSERECQVFQHQKPNRSAEYSQRLGLYVSVASVLGIRIHNCAILLRLKRASSTLQQLFATCCFAIGVNTT
jgi:hypothetical protein